MGARCYHQGATLENHVGDGGLRSPYLTDANGALYQLSYIPETGLVGKVSTRFINCCTRPITIEEALAKKSGHFLNSVLPPLLYDLSGLSESVNYNQTRSGEVNNRGKKRRRDSLDFQATPKPETAVQLSNCAPFIENLPRSSDRHKNSSRI